MKKVISFSLILIGLISLINCSPKTAKQTSSSKAMSEAAKREPDVSVVETPAPAVREEPKKAPLNSATEERSASTLASVSDDRQLAMFKDMGDLRVQMGKKLYTTNCNKCHDYYQPETKTAEQWVTIMRSMGPKANLSTDHYLMVAGYLVQNAKK